MQSEPPEDFAAIKRVVEELRERVARLEAENQRLSIALRGRGDAVHSTLPLRAVNPEAIGLYANRQRATQK